MIGTDDPKVEAVMRELYAPFVRTGKPILVMDPASAELTKYAANAMLATRISFMNEIANLCERVGADVDHVRKGIGTDSRIGPPFLFPGVGYGGSLLPEGREGAHPDRAEEAGLPLHVVEAVERANEAQKRVAACRASKRTSAALAGKTHRGLGPRVQAARPTTCARRPRSR